MERKSYQPKTKQEWLILRSTDLTSTEVSALFGLSPYMTEFELWHRKKNSEIVEIDENERMKWGNRLEAAIAVGVAEDNDWIVQPFKDYVSIKDLHLGSSFDYRIMGKKIDQKAGPDNYPAAAVGVKKLDALLEIKNVDSLVFKDGWVVDGDDLEAPPHIEMQLQHQMLVSGMDTAYIGALIGGNKVTLLKRKAEESIHQAILKKAAFFWASIKENREPSPNFIKDAAFISKLYGYAEPGKVLETTDRGIEKAVASYKELKDTIKLLDGKLDGLKSELLIKIGDAEKVKGETFSISAGIIAPTLVEAFTKKGYRNFRIFHKKPKENINARPK